MGTRRTILALTALALAAGLSTASAGETMPFSAPAFEAAQRSGKPILIAVSAPWCAICKAQKPILAKLSADPRFEALQIFTVDFDSQKALLRSLNVRMQSTLIAYRGAAETGRSVGETQPEWIEGLVEKTL